MLIRRPITILNKSDVSHLLNITKVRIAVFNPIALGGEFQGYIYRVTRPSANTSAVYVLHEHELHQVFVEKADRFIRLSKDGRWYRYYE